MKSLPFVLLMTPALAIGWFRIAYLIRTVSQMALTAAAWWAVISHAVLTVASVCYLTPISEGIKSQLFHFAGVTALCPLLGVLGARFGRLRDWSIFVVVPMVAVLEWPALAQWSQTMSGRPLDLEGPAQLGMCLVIVMAAANYFGTRFEWPAFWFASGWLWNVFRFKVPPFLYLTSQFDLLAAQQLVFWYSVELALLRPQAASGWHRVWLDYRDHFGFVWGSRLLGRINEVAEREKWPWRLLPSGFQAISGRNEQSSDPDSDPRVEQTFRWLLKQFVQPAWIDARSGRSAGDENCSPPQSGAS